MLYKLEAGPSRCFVLSLAMASCLIEEPFDLADKLLNAPPEQQKQITTEVNRQLKVVNARLEAARKALRQAQGFR